MATNMPFPYAILVCSPLSVVPAVQVDPLFVLIEVSVALPLDIAIHLSDLYATSSQIVPAGFDNVTLVQVCPVSDDLPAVVEILD